MYAVIKVGGKQYRVEQGQKLLVDRQPHAPGETFTPPVLMTGSDDVVTDAKELEGAVTAQIVEHLRGEKIRVFTFKPKRGFKKTRGHRSELSRIQIDAIGEAKPKRAPARKAAAEPADGEAGPKPAAKKPAARKPRATAAKAAPAEKPKPARRRAPARRTKEETGDGT